MIEIIKPEIKPFIYLDSAASTIPDQRVIQDIESSLVMDWWNPSSIYEPAREVKRKIEHARDQVRNLINCNKEDDIIFCSSGSEANNLAIKGFMEYRLENKKDVLLITDMVSHPSLYNLSSEYYYYSEGSLNCIYCNTTKDGYLDLNDLEYILQNVQKQDLDILVAITWINNETGIINDLLSIATIVHKYNGLLMVDLSQGIYHQVIDINLWNVDMAIFTSEKCGCPRGVGVLYKRPNIAIKPQIVGGHQENGLRAGTENSALIIPFGNQCSRIKRELINYMYDESWLEGWLVDALDEATYNVCDYKFNFVNSVPNIMSVQFPGIDNQELLTLLEQYGVYASAGSACSSGNKEVSRILLRCGLSDEEALSTIRFSFDHNLKEKDMREFGKILRKCLSSLKV